MDRGITAQSGNLYGFFRTQSVKFNPYIFPWKMAIRDVCTDLMGKQHKALSTFYLILDSLSGRIVCHKFSGSGNNIVKQVMVSRGRAERMGRSALLPTVLVESQVNKIFIWENRKKKIIHKISSLLDL